jgi:signal transduction histidine kinase
MICYRSGMRTHHTRMPLYLLTAALVLMVAVVTGVGLAVARRFQRSLASRTAAYEVLDMGRMITTYLSSRPDLSQLRNDTVDWQDFSRVVDSVYAAEEALQYVSVTRSNQVLFGRHTQALDTGGDALASRQPAPDIDMFPRVIRVGGKPVPVVVFRRRMGHTNAPPTYIEVALKRSAVSRAERDAARALAGMFRLTIATLAVAFGFCTVLVLWMMRREAAREDRRRAEEHLAFSGVLANGIVHDFRNPMSSIRLDAQMLGREAARGEDARPERMASLAGRIRNTLDRMDSVFQEFLTMSRPATDQCEAIDLRACINDCIEVLEPRTEQAQVRIACTEDNPGLRVTAHPNALRRAFINILTNAEEHSPAGSTIRIHLASNETTAIATIDDEGPGIPARERSRVFEMFTTTRPEGTGLGLFLARQSIQRVGGSIRVGEKPTPGTRIEVRLPLAAKGQH